MFNPGKISSPSSSPPRGVDEIRLDRRYKIALPVVVGTRLHDQRGWIVDVARRGVQVRGVKAPPRSKVCIYYRNQYAEGIVRWAKPGPVIGIVLDAPLRSGPLAMVWKRFQDNFDAFGKGVQPPRPIFGRKRPK